MRADVEWNKKIKTAQFSHGNFCASMQWPLSAAVSGVAGAASFACKPSHPFQRCSQSAWATPLSSLIQIWIWSCACLALHLEWSLHFCSSMATSDRSGDRGSFRKSSRQAYPPLRRRSSRSIFESCSSRSGFASWVLLPSSLLHGRKQHIHCQS